MMKLEGIAGFAAVSESGSISEAARRLRLSKSVVSERLAELEKAQSAKLCKLAGELRKAFGSPPYWDHEPAK